MPHSIRGTRRLKDLGIDTGVPVLFSTEKARCALVPCPGDNPADYQVVRFLPPSVYTSECSPSEHSSRDTELCSPEVVRTRWVAPALTPKRCLRLRRGAQVPGFRVRTIPVLGATPALFGQAMAAWSLCTIAKQPFSGEPPFKPRSEQARARLLLCSEGRLMASMADSLSLSERPHSPSLRPRASSTASTSARLSPRRSAPRSSSSRAVQTRMMMRRRWFGLTSTM